LEHRLTPIDFRRAGWPVFGVWLAAVVMSSYVLSVVREVGAQTSGITLVQHTNKDAGASSASTLAFTSTNSAGNWIGVAIRAGSSGDTLTVSDANGNVYRKAVQFNVTVDQPAGDTLAIFYAENIKAGANTITVASSIATTLRFAILEYAGVALMNSLDGSAATQGTSATPTSGPVTTTAAGDLLLAAIASANGRTFTAGGGYVIQDRVPAAPNTKLVAEHQIQAAAGTASATAALSASDNWGAALAAFRPAGNNGGGDTQSPTTPTSLAATASSSSTWIASSVVSA